MYYIMSSRNAKPKKEKSNRYFTIVESSIGFTGGRYNGEKNGAAKKAGSRLFRVAGGDASKTITFTLRETTRGSAHHQSRYQASMKMLDKPVEIKYKKDDGSKDYVTVKYNHQIIVKAID